MTVLIDDTLATMFLTIPLREGWIEPPMPVELRTGLTAAEVTEDDVALLPVPEATLLTRTHVIDRSMAIVHDGVGPVAMRTPVRPDEIEGAEVVLRDVGAAGKALARALMTAYFGIDAAAFVCAHDAPAAAPVVIEEGVAALAEAASGFREDLARSWFIMTGKPYVSHVTVVGVRALARDADDQLATMRSLLDTGLERRRDARRLIREATGVDTEALAAMTTKMRYRLEPDDQEPARMLAERGTRGTAWGRSLPAFRDQLGPTGNTGDTEGD
jgi:hypothetical protein